MNKISESDGIPVELSQILKMMLWKCSTQYASKLGKLSSDHWTGKDVFIPIPKKGNAKECSNYHTITLISHPNKVMLKILQARLQQCMNHELPDVQVGFRKGRGSKDQIANIHWITKKGRESQKNIYFALLTTPKPLTMWITTNWGKFWKRWEYQTTWPASLEICMHVKKQQLELDMEQQSGSKSGKEYVKVVYCHPVYLTYMQSTSGEILGNMKPKLESRLLGEISITSDMQMTPPLWQKAKKN